MRLEHQLHMQCFAAALQDVEQLFAPDAYKTVAATAQNLALELQGNIVPVVKRLRYLGGCLWVPDTHRVHSGV